MWNYFNTKNKGSLVLGYFGYLNNQIDGQTIKTRQVYDLIKEKGLRVKHFDTQLLKSNKVAVLKMIYLILSSSTIIYLPGQNNLKRFFPFLIFLSKMFRKDVVYIVVGGWLYEFLKENTSFKEMLAECKAIFVETNYLCDNLTQKEGLQNVRTFPNFRKQSFQPDLTRDISSHTTRLVFMARIMKEKGLEFVFNFANYIQRQHLDDLFIIDFYGPIQSADENYFFENINSFSFVNYKGVINPSNIYSTLSQYDLLLLPTFYEGEGFPGTILDAYISGIPVLASNWKQIHEFIDVGSTGFLFELDDQQSFNDIIINYSKNKEQSKRMKLLSFSKSSEYSANRAWDLLKPFINI